MVHPPFRTRWWCCVACLFVIATLKSSGSNAYSIPKQTITCTTWNISRRSLLLGFTAPAMTAATMTAFSGIAPSMALDIDSFVQKELDANSCNEKTDKKCMPKLTKDEALCRFGQPSPETGNACVRAGMATTRLTGVDAFGGVDRGNFVKCKPNYVEDPKHPGFLINQWICQ